MLYKVTPAMDAPERAKKSEKTPGQPRARRKSSIYDSDGNEVLITLMCLKCRKVKPLVQFGLRKMADGAIRNQPWCRPCRSAASSKKRANPAPDSVEPLAANPAAPEEPPSDAVLEPVSAPQSP